MGDLEQVFNPDNKEDCVFYYIFPISGEINTNHNHNNAAAGSSNSSSIPAASSRSIEETLFDLSSTAKDIVGHDHIWQKDPFVLWFNPGLGCYQGFSRYEYNVEDEWQIVKILKGLSEKFPDFVIRVFDNDGEFLLIEAADYLPSWAESDENCKLRVYLHKGKVLLIPLNELDLSYEDPDKEGEMMQRAVGYLRNNLDKCIVDGINSAIESRINKLDVHKILLYHEVNAILPPVVAHILKVKHQLISSAVNAFFTMDPIDIKAARMMPNTTPSKGLIKTRVRFTRCLYSMICKQKEDFRPDQKTEWKFPLPNSPDYKSNSLGAKITMGFEVILTRSLKRDGQDPSEREWLRYVENLKKKGYFRGYLEGSKPYQELLLKAKEYFEGILWGNSPQSHPEDVIANELRKIITTYNSTTTITNASSSSASGADDAMDVDVDRMCEEMGIDDDESWLDMGEEELDKILEEHFKGVGDNIPQYKPKDIPGKLKEFMSKMSDYSGVEETVGPAGAGAAPSTSTTTLGAGDTLGEAMKKLDSIEFRADDFISAVDKLLNDLGQPDKEWDASDDEPYSDEDPEMLALEEKVKTKHGWKKDSKIHELMGMMDQELSTTEVGKTFKDHNVSNTYNSTASASTSTSGKINSTTTTTTSTTTTTNDDDDEFNDVESFKPVNIDMNALSSILESFQSQENPIEGPASNLFRSMGVDISKINNNSKSNYENHK